MKIEFDSEDMEDLATKTKFDRKYQTGIGKAYRKRLKLIIAAENSTDLRAMTSFRFEKLGGSRKGEYSIRLNIQWRLIVELKENNSEEIILIKSIEDYH